MNPSAEPRGRLLNAVANSQNRRRPHARAGLRIRSAAALGWLTSGLLLAPIAHGGQPSFKDRQSALVAFEQGRALMSKGQLQEACGRFDQAMQLHPRVGYALNLAECEEKRGRLTVAATHWAAAEELAKTTRDNRLAVAHDRAQKLDKRIPRLTVTLVPSAPADAAITVASGTLEPSDWTTLGTPAPLDPGGYRFVLRADGFEEGTFEVTLAESDRKELQLAPGPPIVSIPIEPPPPPEPEPEPSFWDMEWSDWRTSGVVLGATGLVSLGVGTALGIMALDRRDDAAPHCNERNICNADGVALRDEAFDLAHGSTATLVGGGVLLAGGAVLFFVPELLPDDETENEEAPLLTDDADLQARGRRHRPSIHVTPTPGGLVVFGQW